MTSPGPRRPSPGRFLGLYALSVMDREGPLYGYRLSSRVAERTGGSWRPGPGTVYPAFAALVRRGLARPSKSGRRRVYRITRNGRALVRRVRERMALSGRGGPDVGILWAEISGHPEPGRFLLERFEHQLGRVIEFLTAPTAPPETRRLLRRRALVRLERAEARLRAAEIPRARRSDPRRGAPA